MVYLRGGGVLNSAHWGFDISNIVVIMEDFEVNVIIYVDYMYIESSVANFRDHLMLTEHKPSVLGRICE